MGGKHRKSRYDSSSLSATDTSDSSYSESSDSEVTFVLNHSHGHKSQHRINKLKHIKSKSITQIVTPTEQIEILMTGIAKIELHTTQKGINLTMDITIEIKIIMIGHQKQIPMTGIPML